MQIKLSPLNLKDLAIINFNYSFSPAKDEELPTLFEKYLLDVNFATKKISESLYQVMIKVDINNKELKKFSGYSIFAECVGVYQISQSKIESIELEEIKSLLTNSGLIMTLNFLRNFIAITTSSFPYGKYFMPSIDLKDLIEQKMKAIEAAKAQAKTKPSASKKS